jgi:hypothetical protein
MAPGRHHTQADTVTLSSPVLVTVVTFVYVVPLIASQIRFGTALFQGAREKAAALPQLRSGLSVAPYQVS